MKVITKENATDNDRIALIIGTSDWFDAPIDELQKMLDDVTFDQLMDNFDYYRAAQSHIIYRQLPEDWVKYADVVNGYRIPIWIIDVDDFIKQFDLDDEDVTMLKLAHG